MSSCVGKKTFNPFYQKAKARGEMYGVSYTEKEVSNVDMSLQRNFYIKFPYICRHTFSLELCSDERIIFWWFKMDFSYTSWNWQDAGSIRMYWIVTREFGILPQNYSITTYIKGNYMFVRENKIYFIEGHDATTVFFSIWIKFKPLDKIFQHYWKLNIGSIPENMPKGVLKRRQISK